MLGRGCLLAGKARRKYVGKYSRTSVPYVGLLYAVATSFFIAGVLAAAPGARDADGEQLLPSEFTAHGIRFVLVKKRRFMMGRDPEELYGQDNADVAPYETPRHRVKLKANFYVSESMISRSQYDQSGLPGDAEDVSWEEAAAFAEWMNEGQAERSGWRFRLPTEAEWQCVHDFHRGRGVQDIGEGEREWTGDWLGPFRPGERTNPLGPRHGHMKVTREDGTKRMSQPINARSHMHESGRVRFRLVAVPSGSESYPAGEWDPSPFHLAAVKDNSKARRLGPDPKKPYFHMRLALPIPPDSDFNLAGMAAGLDGGGWSHNHSPGLTVLPNGDVLAIWFSGRNRNAEALSLPEPRQIVARLRHGAEVWDPPEVFKDWQDINDGNSVMFTDFNRGETWYFSSGGEKGERQCEVAKTTNSGASWDLWLPDRTTAFMSAQPVTNAFRDPSGRLYFVSDGQGGESFLFFSDDEGRTWAGADGRTSTRHATIVPVKRSSSSPEVDGVRSIIGKDRNPNAADVSFGRDGEPWGDDFDRVEEFDDDEFPPLGSNQRPAAYRLANGKIVVVYDSTDTGARRGRNAPNPYIAISDDEGETWTRKELPLGRRHHLFWDEEDTAATLGYATVTQGPNGVIHILTTLTSPGLHYELNEEWIYDEEAGAMEPDNGEFGHSRSFRDHYPDGTLKAKWNAVITKNGRYLLSGSEKTYYPDGTLEFLAHNYRGYRQNATYFSPDGRKRWKWTFELGDTVNGSDDAWLSTDVRGEWRQYSSNGRTTKLLSQWISMPLLDLKTGEDSSTRRRLPGLLADGPAVHYGKKNEELHRFEFVEGCLDERGSCIDESD